MGRFERMMDRKANLKAAEAAGIVADSKEVRIALMERVHSGEITLEQAQAELSRIKRGAKKSGKVTRSQAYRNRTFLVPTGVTTCKGFEDSWTGRST